MAPDPRALSLLGNWILHFYFEGKTYTHHMAITKLWPENAGAPDPVSGYNKPFSFNANGWDEADPGFKWRCKESSVSLYYPFPVDFWIRHESNDRYSIHAWGQISWGVGSPGMGGQGDNYGKAIDYTHSNPISPYRTGAWDARKQP